MNLNRVSPTPVATATVNTIIVGGGHAGVNLACMLELQPKKDNDYLILERSTSLLSKWRDKRWDHFQLNTPVKFSRLHGQEINDPRDDWLVDRPIQQDIDVWDDHIKDLEIIKRTKLNSNVVSVTPLGDGTFETIVEAEGREEGNTKTTVYRSKNVVACNGAYDHNNVPSSLANDVPSSIKQHVTGGFKLQDLSDGNILVVGSA